MSALDEDLEAVEGVVSTYEAEYGRRRGAGDAMARIRQDIARLRDLAQGAFDHPNYTPQPGDERLK